MQGCVPKRDASLFFAPLDMKTDSINHDDLAALLGFKKIWSRTSSRRPLAEIVRSALLPSAGVYLKASSGFAYIGETSNLARRTAKYLSQGEDITALYFIPKQEGRRKLEAELISQASRLGAKLTNIRRNAGGEVGACTIAPLDVVLTPSAAAAHLRRIEKDDCLFDFALRAAEQKASYAERRAYEEFSQIPGADSVLLAAAELAALSAPSIFSLAPRYWCVLVMPPHFDAEKRTLLALSYGSSKVVEALGIKNSGKIGIVFRVMLDALFLSEADAELMLNIELSNDAAYCTVPLELISRMIRRSSFRTAFASAAMKALSAGGPCPSRSHNSIAAAAMKGLAAQSVILP